MEIVKILKNGYPAFIYAVKRSPEFCCQKMEILCSENGNSVLRKWKFYSNTKKWTFCTQKIENLPMPCQVGLSAMCHTKSDLSVLPCPILNCMIVHDRRILCGLYSAFCRSFITSTCFSSVPRLPTFSRAMIHVPFVLLFRL